jgi:hypothetical protein
MTKADYKAKQKEFKESRDARRKNKAELNEKTLLENFHNESV